MIDLRLKNAKFCSIAKWIRCIHKVFAELHATKSAICYLLTMLVIQVSMKIMYMFTRYMRH